MGSVHIRYSFLKFCNTGLNGTGHPCQQRSNIGILIGQQFGTHIIVGAKDLKNAKFKLEQSKARVDEIDRVLTKLYEDNALGKITDERFERLSATYEKEQRELADCIIESETEITEAEQDNVDLKHFLKAIRACTDLKELTPEIVNTLIKRINVHNAEKVDGRKKVKIDIEFIAVGLISIPDEKELLTLMEEIRNEKVA